MFIERAASALHLTSRVRVGVGVGVGVEVGVGVKVGVRGGLGLGLGSGLGSGSGLGLGRARIRVRDASRFAQVSRPILPVHPNLLGWADAIRLIAADCADVDVLVVVSELLHG